MEPATDTFRERLKERLRVVTEAVLSAEGLAAAQARRIAREAGCSVGTIYNIYGDIDQLILAANATTLGDLSAALDGASRAAVRGDLEVRLMALALGYLEFASLNANRWRAVFEQRLPDDYPVPATYLDDRSRLLALIERELAVAIPSPCTRQDAARALFSAVHGNVQLALDLKLGAFDPALCARQIHFIVRNVARGLAPFVPP